MANLLETLAFALLIGGQFLAVLVVFSKRAALYPDSARQRPDPRQLETPDRPVASRPQAAEAM
jgi:hypothetical protein